MSGRLLPRQAYRGFARIRSAGCRNGNAPFQGAREGVKYRAMRATFASQVPAGSGALGDEALQQRRHGLQLVGRETGQLRIEFARHQPRQRIGRRAARPGQPELDHTPVRGAAAPLQQAFLLQPVEHARHRSAVVGQPPRQLQRRAGLAARQQQHHADLLRGQPERGQRLVHALDQGLPRPRQVVADAGLELDAGGVVEGSHRAEGKSVVSRGKPRPVS